MKGIDGGYKLTELLFGREDSADAIVNVTAGSRKTLKRKFIFQIGTLNPTESASAFHSTNLFLFSRHHIPTNGVAPISAYKPTHNPRFLQSL